MATPSRPVVVVADSRPCLGEVIVEDRQGDVGEEGRQDTSNAVANFEFSVSLPYRRGEKPKRRSTTQSDAKGSI